MSLMVCAGPSDCPSGGVCGSSVVFGRGVHRRWWCPLTDDVCGHGGMSTSRCACGSVEARLCACQLLLKSLHRGLRQPFPRLSWTVAPERSRHHRDDHDGRTHMHRWCTLPPLRKELTPCPRRHSSRPAGPTLLRCANTLDCVTTTRGSGRCACPAHRPGTAPQVQTRCAPPRTATLRTKHTKRPRKEPERTAHCPRNETTPTRTGPDTAGARHEKKHRRRRQGTTTPRQRKDPNRRDDAPAAEPHLLPGFSASGSQFG